MIPIMRSIRIRFSGLLMLLRSRFSICSRNYQETQKGGQRNNYSLSSFLLPKVMSAYPIQVSLLWFSRCATGGIDRPKRTSSPCDYERQMVVETHPTDDPPQNDHVYSTVRPRYLFHDQLVRPQEVIIYTT